MSGLVWVVWRQQRRLLLAGVAIVAGVALAGLIEPYQNLSEGGSMTRAIAAFLPAALGVFWGAPFLARPLENGTAELTWTQTVPRLRWLAGALIVLAVATLGTIQVVRGIVLPLVLDAGFRPGYTHDVESVVALGYAAFAVALGVFAGAILGRVEPAMAVTLLVYAFVRFAVGELRWQAGSPEQWPDLQWAEFAGYGGLAAALIAGTFVVVARRGTSA
jgi:hypothetical protein